MATLSCSRALARCAIAVVVLAVPPLSLLGQVGTEVRVTGRVTDLAGIGITDATVLLTPVPGTVTVRAATDSAGRYSLIVGRPGPAIIVATAAGFAAARRREDLPSDSSTVLDFQLARSSATVLEGVKVLAERREALRRNRTDPDVGGSERLLMGATRQPVAGGDRGELAALAGKTIGVTRVDRESESGTNFSVLGANPSRNVVALDGLPLGATRLPADAVIAAKVTSTSYDVSRGGFSGGRLDLSIIPGANITSQNMRATVTAPFLQFGPGANLNRYRQFGQFDLGLGRSGPLAIDKVFYRIASDIHHRTEQLTALDAPQQVVGAVTGIDLATRNALLGAASSLLLIPSQNSHRTTNSGTALFQIDVNPLGERSWSLTTNADARVAEPILGGNSSPGGFGVTLYDYRGGLQVKRIAPIFGAVNESSAGISVRNVNSQSTLDRPAAHVIVPSTRGGFAQAELGAPAYGFNGLRDINLAGRSETSWRMRRQVVRTSVELTAQSVRSTTAPNPFGVYTFPSLASLVSNIPESFNRQDSSSGLFARVASALTVGSTWRPTERFALQYGARLDISRFVSPGVSFDRASVPDLNTSRRLPSFARISPRMGISWQYGVNDRGAPRGTFNAGLGRFVGAVDAATIASAVVQRHVRTLLCTGPSTPPLVLVGQRPPGECVSLGGGATVNDIVAGTIAFKRGYGPSESWRASVDWSGSSWETFIPEIGITYARDGGLASVSDANFSGNQRFLLDNEAARPVYALPSEIDAQTGMISPSAARVVPGAGQLRLLSSDLHGSAWQLTATAIRSKLGGTFIRVGYAYQRAFQESRGFDRSNFDSPREVFRAASNYEIRHAVKGSVIMPVRQLGTLTAFGEVRSGRRFTPLILGDVNGDGYVNDRAFIFDPQATPGTTLSKDLQRLLDQAEGHTRRCLARQLDQVAGPQSCSTPAVASIDSRFQLKRGIFGLPPRATIALEALNVHSGIDQLVHWGRPRGWGQPSSANPFLFRVKGFDPQARQFSYDVNPSFGTAPIGQAVSAAPFTLRIEARVDLSSDPVKQQLRIDRQRERNPTAEALLARYLVRYPNPFSVVMQLRDSIGLSEGQATALTKREESFLANMRAIWVPVADYVKSDQYDQPRATGMIRDARSNAASVFSRASDFVRELLDQRQLRRLPAAVQFLLEPAFLDQAGLR